jgi:hypothetical protein
MPSSRRDFLAASTLFALAGRTGLADEPKTAGANDAIVLGFIGVGGMGTGLLRIFKGFSDVRVAAVCDVYEPHGLRAREAADGAPELYADFRRVLDRKDIDAVVVATPDHWHAIVSILACQAGKDVYCEKPLAYTIGEGRRMVDAARKHQRVTQMGNLIHAGETYHRMVEIVRSGVLGTIRCSVLSAAPPTATRPPAVITTSGLDPLPSGRSTRTASRSTGATSGTTPGASSATSSATWWTRSTGP